MTANGKTSWGDWEIDDNNEIILTLDGMSTHSGKIENNKLIITSRIYVYGYGKYDPWTVTLEKK